MKKHKIEFHDFGATSKIGQPIQPTWYEYSALSSSALNEPTWDFNVFICLTPLNCINCCKLTKLKIQFTRIEKLTKNDYY